FFKLFDSADRRAIGLSCWKRFRYVTGGVIDGTLCCVWTRCYIARGYRKDSIERARGVTALSLVVIGGTLTTTSSSTLKTVSPYLTPLPQLALLPQSCNGAVVAAPLTPLESTNS